MGDTARSYSQLSTWTDCPRQYQLDRVLHIPRRPGWYFPGGTAVHAVIEAYLLQSLVKSDPKGSE